MISQESYAYSINTIALSKDQLSNKEFGITLGTVPSVRFLLGQLNWLAQIPRPDISFDICNLSTEVKHMKVCNVINLNKAIRHIKRDTNKIVFPHLDLNSIEIIIYTDVSYTTYQREEVRVVT